MQQKQHQGDGRPSIQGGTNLLWLGANCYSTCFTVFIRTGFGTEALGVNGVGAVILILIGMSEGGDPGAFLNFLYAWLCALVVQRVRTAKMVNAGLIEHSRYSGWPSLTLKLFPFIKSEMRAKGVEPGLCAVAGVLLAPMSPPLAAFVFCGAFALAVVRGMEQQVNRMRVQQMRDAEIEHRQLAMRFRGELKEF
jgi:hypothetical protein